MSDVPKLATRVERERDFWDHVVPTVDEVIREFRAGPEPNTRLMLDLVAPGPRRRVLDFACGGGVTSAWLAERGAEVTGVDLSPVSIRTAEEVGRRLGLDVDFRVADVEQLELPPGGFDAIVSRYALHHLDVAAMAPVLARCLAPGGVGAFLETMGMNPLLNLARDHLTGRFGIPRFGTVDEHPLRPRDIALLSAAFGSAELQTAEYRFISMIDRQILQGRRPKAGQVLRWIDDRLATVGPLKLWSFHQVVIVRQETAVLTVGDQASVQRWMFAHVARHQLDDRRAYGPGSLTILRVM